MRIAIFYVVMVVVAIPAAGQEYDLEPENWFPLEVGNNWHYTNEGGEGVGAWIDEWIVESVRDTVVDGQRWTLLSAVHCVKQSGPTCPSGELGWYRFSADDYLLARDTFSTSNADTVLKTQPFSVFSVNVSRDSLYSEFMRDSVAVRITTGDPQSDSTHFQLHVDGNIYFGGRYIYNVGNGARLIGAIVDGVEYGETEAIEYYQRLPLESPAEQPNKFAVVSTYPNPFRGAVTVEYALPSAGHVRVNVYDVMGRRIRTDVVGPLPAGTHEFTLRDDGLAAGAYIVRFSNAQGRMATAHVVLVE